MFQAIHISSLEILFGAQFLGTAVLLASIIPVDRLHAQMPQRERLNARFQRSQLREMLRFRRRDTEAFLETVSTAVLDRHLEICSDCSQKKQCETALRDGSAASFAFCPNETMIERLPQLQEPQHGPLPSRL
jgi:hypothetical protein